MVILSASEITKNFGERTLFEGVSFDVNDKDMIGLVGANGAGKTTLFKLITGETLADKGALSKNKTLKIGYMEQHICNDSAQSAIAEVLTIFDELIKIEAEIEELSNKLLTNHSHELIEKSLKLHERFENQGGLTYKSRARSTILALGLSEEEIELPISVLSGGQRSKISLAKLLLSHADLLLLDEPTNHLDIAAVEWLEDFLHNYKGAAMIISHDRYFLDSVTKKTLELQAGKFYKSNHSYSAHRQKRETDREIEEKHFEIQKREIEKAESSIAKLKQFNREKSIKRAESKEKQVEKLKDALEAPETTHKGLKFTFKPKRTSGNDVLEAENLKMQFDNRVLYDNVSFKIFRGERIFLLGANGSGKTTIFKQLIGGKGEIRFGSQVDTGYYDQTLSGLDPQKTVLNEVWDDNKLKNQTEIRSALAVFLFKGNDVFKSVSALSGGERARIELLKLMNKGYNFLLLDEPTNHLDTYSREALEDALLAYEGTMLIISHDRYFINKLADRIYFLKPNGVDEYVGNYDVFAEKRVANEPLKAEKIYSAHALSYKEKKEKEATIRKIKTQIERLEQNLEKIDAEKKSLLEAMQNNADYNKIIAMSEEIKNLEENESSLLIEWEQLHEALEAD